MYGYFELIGMSGFCAVVGIKSWSHESVCTRTICFFAFLHVGVHQTNYEELCLLCERGLDSIQPNASVRWWEHMLSI